MMWVLIVFLNGIEREPVYFSDINTCLEYSNKLKAKTLIKEWLGTRYI